jgi:hypothetical protein
MRGLPVVMFAAAIAIWGLASVPGGSGNDRTPPAYRRWELARTTDGAFPRPTQRGAALGAARFDSRGPWQEDASACDPRRPVARPEISAMIHEFRVYEPPGGTFACLPSSSRHWSSTLFSHVAFAKLAAVEK